MDATPLLHDLMYWGFDPLVAKMVVFSIKKEKTKKVRDSSIALLIASCLPTCVIRLLVMS
jgi:hypothetical protein